MTRSKDESLKTFNNVAVDYDMTYEGWSKDTHPFILDKLKSEPVTSILDVGCGTGTMPFMMTKRARKAD
jgi:ubiquinone/menaquinone biosynthesis C-methylase UbiE